MGLAALMGTLAVAVPAIRGSEPVTGNQAVVVPSDPDTESPAVLAWRETGSADISLFYDGDPSWAETISGPQLAGASAETSEASVEIESFPSERELWERIQEGTGLSQAEVYARLDVGSVVAIPDQVRTSRDRVASALADPEGAELDRSDYFVHLSQLELARGSQQVSAGVIVIGLPLVTRTLLSVGVPSATESVSVVAYSDSAESLDADGARTLTVSTWSAASEEGQVLDQSLTELPTTYASGEVRAARAGAYDSIAAFGSELRVGITASWEPSANEWQAIFAALRLGEPPDVSPPTITFRTPVGGGVYLRDQVVNADYSCADEPGGSGVERCVGPVPAGAALDTSTVGAKTFQVLTRDAAGNEATAQISYRVDPRQLVSPVLECVRQDASGGIVARFGYLNRNAATIKIPLGANNRFTLAPIDRGQPTTFEPGRRRGVFEAPVGSLPLIWELEGSLTNSVVPTIGELPPAACAPVGP